MLARLQALIASFLLVAILAWIGASIAGGHWRLAAAGPGAIAAGYALFMGAEFALMWRVQPERPSLRQVSKAWWQELVTAPSIFLWRQPFRSTALADFVPAAPQGEVGVVLVHGFVCNRGLWNPWLVALKMRGTPCIAVNLEPPFGSIDGCVAAIDAAAQRLRAATGRPVVLVGHSMGGVAIRVWMARFDTDHDVRRVLTIGTPHHGTWLARFGHTQNARQLRQRNAWLQALAARESASRRAKFTCYYSDCDNIVFPARTATLPDAENVLVPGQAHMQLAFNPVVFDGLLRWLD